MPLVIPVFIPHQGCPHACIFCNQLRISGQGADTLVTPSEVQDTILLWLNRDPGRSADKVQVAFYGGSFTGLPLTRQQELLQAVAPFLESGQVQSIRLSTRPDYIDSKTVEFLRAYGVATVELGVQSLDDRVLEASCRGHKASHTYKAVEFLRQGGLETGLQIMLGLPKQSTRSLMHTVKEVADLQPDFVRIYPVLILRDSKLSTLYNKGEYSPLTLNNAVVKAAWMKKHFDAQGIRVVRMGLQAGPELEKNLVAGPYHPTFGEMVSSRLMLQKTRRLFAGVKEKERVLLTINEKDQSIFRGVKSANMKRLAQLNLLDRFSLQVDAAQPRHSVTMVVKPEPQAVNLDIVNR